MITGEFRLVEKSPGDRAIAGRVIVAINAQFAVPGPNLETSAAQRAVP